MTSRATLAIYAAFTALVLYPVLSVPVPCLGDYLNHLARIHILTTIGSSPVLQRFYVPGWRVAPYYGMDLPVALLARLTGLYAAGRVFVALCVVMPVAATAMLRWAAVGRVGLAPVLAFALSYNFVLAFGFLNYLFCACLAVMLFAGWVATCAWSPVARWVVFASGALLVYLGHAFSLVVYAILLAGFELGRAWQGRPLALRSVMGSPVLAMSTLAPPVLFWAVRQDRTPPAGGIHTHFDGALAHLASVASPLYFPGSDAVTFAFVALACLGVVWIVVTGSMAAALRPPILLLTLAWLLTPHILFNMSAADIRLPLVLGIVLIASLQAPVGAGADRRGVRLLAVVGPLGTQGPERVGGPWTRSLGIMAAGLVAALICLRCLDASEVLHRLYGQVLDVRRAVAGLPEGARVIVVDAESAEPGRIVPPFMSRQLPLLASIDRDALVPYVFTQPTPLAVRPALRAVTSPFARAVSPEQLWQGLTDLPEAANGTPFGDGGHVYWARWQDHYDYVLVMRFGGAGLDAPPNLSLQARNRTADLFRISR